MMNNNPEKKTSFKVQNLSFAYTNKLIVEDLSFNIAQGKITALLGANGSGKSTLFRLLSKNLKPRPGAGIKLDGRSINDYRLGELAKKVAVVWQKNTAPYDITVRELVAYGRIPHKKAFQSMTHQDEAAVEKAINICELSDIAESRVQDLSGGQQQRCWIALGLAQETPIIFIDEPTTFLDVRYQVMILRLIRKLNQEHGKTIVLILHDVNQTLDLCDELIALKPGGSEIIQGTPQDLITEDFLFDIYGTDLRMATIEDQSIVFSHI
jgi:iron complex transport system ATP-binding protein